jgi:hypothetical protein
MSEFIQELARELNGTCERLYDVLSRQGREELTQAECEELDEAVMCCDTCSWWVDSDEIDEDGNCSDCTAHNEDADE